METQFLMDAKGNKTAVLMPVKSTTNGWNI
jgi:hypothetical protein